jgi:viroplasmin and RNaseH domain-containing protein
MFLNLVALVLQISRSCSCSMMTWYVVYRGRHPGVYSNWIQLCLALAGGENNLYQGFKTRKEADVAFLAFRLSIVCRTS